MPTVGEWVLERRKALGFRTREELLRKTHLSLATLGRIERDDKDAERTRATLSQLATALNVDTEAFVEWGIGRIDFATFRSRTEGGDLVAPSAPASSNENKSASELAQPRIPGPLAEKIAEMAHKLGPKIFSGDELSLLDRLASQSKRARSAADRKGKK